MSKGTKQENKLTLQSTASLMTPFVYCEDVMYLTMVYFAQKKPNVIYIILRIIRQTVNLNKVLIGILYCFHTSFIFSIHVYFFLIECYYTSTGGKDEPNIETFMAW
jgi:hypothetical protein